MSDEALAYLEPAVVAIPGSIVRALCAVQASVEAVTKSGFNKHGGYKFSSTDDIYAALTKKMGEVGLLIYPLELKPVEESSAKVDVFDKDGTKTGEKTVTKLRFHFGYVLATEDASWFDTRSSRSIILLHNGPQTFQGAESFCQKAYLRALFKLPTGDLDLDSMPQAETEEDQAALSGNGAKKRKSSYAAKKDGTEALFNEISAKVNDAPNKEILQQVRTLYAEEWNELPHKWVELLEGDYETKMMGFGNGAHG